MYVRYNNAGFAFILLLLCTVKLYAGSITGHTAAISYAPLCFIENKGQVKDQYGKERIDIGFKLAYSSVNVFIGNGRLHYEWFKQEKDTDGKTPLTEIYRVDASLIGANANAVCVTENEQPYSEHYYSSQIPDGITARSFRKIIYKNIYDHIDWVLYAKDNKLKYEFIVHPGGKADQIKIKYDGATKQELVDGSFKVYSPFGEIGEQQPYSFEWESKKSIRSTFIVRNNLLGFDVGAHTGTLVIDPFVNWITYYGGADYDYGLSCAADAAGNVVMAGRSRSTNNIASVGAFQTSCAGSDDGMLVKFNKEGLRQWGTYFGGVNGETFSSVDIGAYGNIYAIATPVTSAGLATPGAWQTTNGGGSDILLAKFNANGARIWSTYYGGNFTEDEGMLKCDKYENIYVLGSTLSSNNISSSGSFHPNKFTGNNRDVFLAKFDALGTRQWATYAGGPADDWAGGITCDTFGNVYIGGYTSSTSDIATPGSYQTAYGGAIWDAFLMKFSGAGTQVWGTYYGGAKNDNIVDVACDDTGNVYIAGYTQSSTGIATAGSYKPVSTITDENYLAKFDATGARIWGSYYGETYTQINGMTLNSHGDIFFCGYTTSAFDIATPITYQSVLNGGQDAILVQMNNSGTSVLWATYLGGNSTETASDCAWSPAGYIYVTGYTQSTAQFATPDAFQPIGGGDAFLAAFADRDVFVLQPFTDTMFCPADIFNLAYGVSQNFNAGNIFDVQLSDAAGSFANPTVIGSKSAVGAGVINCFIPIGLVPGKGYRIRIVASDPFRISKDDGIAIQIKHTPNFTALSNSPVCVGAQLKLVAVSATPGLTYSWVGPLGFSSNSGAPVINNMQYVNAGNYFVTVTDAGCNATNTVTVFVDSIPGTPMISSNTPVCAYDTLKLAADSLIPNCTFTWAGPHGFTSDIQMPSVAPAKLLDAGVYCVTITAKDGCMSLAACDTVIIYPKPAPPSVADTNICRYIKKPLLNITGTNLTWYTDSATMHTPQPDINTSTLGRQMIQVTQTANGCESDKALFNVDITGTPVFSLGGDKIICKQQHLIIGESQNNVSYLWNTGSTECCIAPATPGTYIQSITNNCGTTSDTVLLTITECDSCIFVPSAFTPNNDGKNDRFGALLKCPLTAYTLNVYNRWGVLIFHSDDPTDKWDGRYKGVVSDIGTYYYFITYRPALFESQEFTVKGDVVLVR